MYVVSPPKIARRYLRTWFFVDLVSLTPVDLLEIWVTNKNQSQVIRFSRLLRLLRMMHVVKMLKLIRKSTGLNDWLNALDIDVNFLRMLKFQLFSMFLIHLMSCIWFLVSTFENNLYLTWVGQRDLVGSTPLFQYSNAVYWAIQTITTVGFGDFTL